MDYATARERLDKPRRQDGKNLGHKLRLYKFDTGHGGDDAIGFALSYHTTSILKFYRTHTVISPGGYVSSRTTRDKLNEYMPRGWRLMPYPCRFERRTYVGLITKRSPSWEHLWSYPYEDDSTWTEDGRIELEGTAFAGENTGNIVDDISATVDVTVNTFLQGTFEDEVTGFSLSSPRKPHVVDKIIDIAKKREPSPMFLRALLRLYSDNSHGVNPKLYYRDNFKRSSSTPTTEVEKMRHFERLLEGERNIRPKSNSPEFFAFRSTLKARMERALLEYLGFDLWTA